MKQFLLWVRECPNDAASELVDVMRYKAEMCKRGAIVACFIGHSDLVMLEIGPQQTWQAGQASLAIAIYSTKDEGVAELFKFLFHHRNVPLTLINVSYFLHLILETNEKRSSTPFYNMMRIH